jgi:D-alanyl-D-alanine carboxypeptidase (penicillin-binding protein 5/6)
MTRKSIFKILTSISLFTVIVVFVLGYNLWQASGQIDNYIVKGASTQNQPAPAKNVKLEPFPVFTPPADINIRAKEWVLYDPTSGIVLDHSQDLSPVSIASTTKIMSMYLVIKYGNLNDVVTVSQAAASLDSSNSLMGIIAGEQLTVKDLMCGALLVSGNDAVHALAEYIGGKLLNDPNASSSDKIARFVTLMNDEAKTLHLTSTHYIDPAGYDDTGHSNALDIAKIASLAIQVPVISQIMTTPEIVIRDQQQASPAFDLQNSNWLVSDYQYPGLIGGKTGYTPTAGHCLMSASTQNGHTLIAVVLHTDDDTPNASAIEVQKLLNYGFANTVWK